MIKFNNINLHYSSVKNLLHTFNFNRLLIKHVGLPKVSIQSLSRKVLESMAEKYAKRCVIKYSYTNRV